VKRPSSALGRETRSKNRSEEKGIVRMSEVKSKNEVKRNVVIGI